MQEAVQEYFNNYFDGNLSESTTNEEIMEAVYDLIDLTNAVMEAAPLSSPKLVARRLRRTGAVDVSRYDRDTKIRNRLDPVKNPGGPGGSIANLGPRVAGGKHQGIRTPSAQDVTQRVLDHNKNKARKDINRQRTGAAARAGSKLGMSDSSMSDAHDKGAMDVERKNARVEGYDVKPKYGKRIKRPEKTILKPQKRQPTPPERTRPERTPPERTSHDEIGPPSDVDARTHERVAARMQRGRRRKMVHGVDWVHGVRDRGLNKE